ncbi:TetR/AcrR family transcriptional regulator [Herbiconiux ginsengi]|uniref:Transcriptional regulator, TetR family n=1 Tax=Herbiconiux ginsengi TaxID=381665 RepID=A0A1H3LJY4_9MICO|nr:TetR/AcrR family transcriptional regulator [Herbiconiux ginsengi]SDY64274.1 transcriptional regulator, TetR family [Herbiconiux ginsengi]
MPTPAAVAATTPLATDRRRAVMASALITFARFGYHKTSMEQIAKAAHISRPGLYFLFASKEELFRDAVTQSLEEDLNEVERILGAKDRALPERLLASFDCWAGRYVGPLAQDITRVIDDNPALLGDVVDTAPRRFADLVFSSIAARAGRSEREAAAAITQTMISASIGIKHQADDRAAYLERMKVAIEVLLE